MREVGGNSVPWWGEREGEASVFQKEKQSRFTTLWSSYTCLLSSRVPTLAFGHRPTEQRFLISNGEQEDGKAVRRNEERSEMNSRGSAAP